MASIRSLLVFLAAVLAMVQLCPAPFAPVIAATVAGAAAAGASAKQQADAAAAAAAEQAAQRAMFGGFLPRSTAYSTPFKTPEFEKCFGTLHRTKLNITSPNARCESDGTK